MQERLRGVGAGVRERSLGRARTASAAVTPYTV